MKDRNRLVIFLVLATIVAVAAFAVGYFMQDDNRLESSISCDEQITINQKVFKCVELADTPDLRANGLSGRPELTIDEAMLFRFDEPAQHGIWMKEMLFPLDILWADESGKIVTIEKNVSPQTCPQPFSQDNCQVFSSGQPALYVLEILAGQVDANDINVGDTIEQL